MAVSNVIKSAEGTSAKAPVSAPAPATAGNKAKNGAQAAFRAKGAALRAKFTEDEKAMEGTKQDKVAFVSTLGNPARRQDRVEDKKSIPSYEVCGYRFKALEDMEVPVIPLKSSNYTDVDYTKATTKAVKAGEIFDLNIMETASLITRVEYAGTFSGENTPVQLSAKSSKVRDIPLPILTLASAKGSIKSTMILIADITEDKETGRVKAIVKEEFAEKFGIWFVKKSATRTASTNRTAGEAPKDLAAAFRSFFSQKQ